MIAPSSSGSGSGRAREISARGRMVAFALLAFCAVVFLGFNYQFVPRLTNNHFGDAEFTGWSGPLGARWANGEIAYDDYVLPIPPGSFLVLGFIQKWFGEYRLLQELWLIAILQLVTSGVGYTIAVRLCSRRIATLVAIASFATLLQLNKECAYDATAQCTAWLSIAAGAWALSTEAPRRLRFWTLAGAFATATLVFKQSTAVGVVAGWFAVFLYRCLLYRKRNDTEGQRDLLRSALGFARGLIAGSACVLLTLLSIGSSPAQFLQATFPDASQLKGGSLQLLTNLFGYLVIESAYPASFMASLALLWVGARLIRHHGTLRFPTSPRDDGFSAGSTIVIVAGVLLSFGGAVYLSQSGFGPMPPNWVHQWDRLKSLPSFGLVFVTAFFVLRLAQDFGREGDSRSPRASGALPLGRQETFQCLVIVSLCCSLLHNTSAPELRPFYDNNPIIVIALVAMFCGLQAARLTWLQHFVFLLLLLSIFGNKFDRATIARTKAADGTHWQGLWLNDRGVIIEEAAALARKSAGSEGTVLVLPEDIQLSSLIGRRRPHLRGAIVFVDQYPGRLTVDDIASLDQNPPTVVVVHPRNSAQWQRFFRIWSANSAAETVIQHVIGKLLPTRYRRIGSFDTVFNHSAQKLDIYRLKTDS